LRQRRPGFTLIELLVVIGIILTLIGILIMGFRHVNKAAAQKETLAELHIARGMLTEYENHAGLQGIESNAAQATDTTPATKAPPYPDRLLPVYHDPAPSLTPATGSLPGWPFIRVSGDITSMPGGEPTQGTVQIPGATLGFQTPMPFFIWDLGDTANPPSTDVSNRMGTSARYAAAAIQRTRDVMFVLGQVPANRSLVQTVQSKRILEADTSQGAASVSMDLEGPVLLDGWGNPIIFVPRGGLHVLMPDQVTASNPTGEYVVRSTGTFPAPSSVAPALTGAERPFFASAGQDGDFTIGEDNVYSFQE
jgi:prepilin-type N-terminal cleavage/methylation domain-containing protein